MLNTARTWAVPAPHFVGGLSIRTLRGRRREQGYRGAECPFLWCRAVSYVAGEVLGVFPYILGASRLPVCSALLWLFSSVVSTKF